MKYKVDGTVKCYKAYLVAKGFTQTYSIVINSEPRLDPSIVRYKKMTSLTIC